MSIVTKKAGDHGATSLMYNRRVSKCHPRIEACGCVDELNSALGLARATAPHDFVRDNLLAVQKELVILMGELATAVEDLLRYVQDGYPPVTPRMTARLDKLVTQIEGQNLSLTGWATPGSSLHPAALDMARTICRRAERRACALEEAGQLKNPEIIAYLNRLSDLLWMFARWAEAKPGTEPTKPA